MFDQNLPKDRCYFLQIPLVPDPADRSVSQVFSAPLDITYAMREIVGTGLITLEMLVSEQDRQNVRRTLRGLLARNEVMIEFRHRAENGDGSVIWFEGLASVVSSAGSLGVPILSLQAHDVTEEIMHRWRSDMELETIRFALSENNLGFWNTDLVTGDTWFSENWYSALGYRPGEFPPSREIFFELLHPEDAKSVGPALGKVVEGVNRTYKMDFRLKCADGSYKWIEAIGGRVEAGASSSPVLCGLHNDIDARKEAERELTIAKSRAERANAELAHSAAHDDLTGLPNRRFFMQRIETRFGEDPEVGQFTTVIRVDLDFFKEINDTIGHDAGDEVLAHVADILRAAVRSGDTVARVGGDEFIALLGPQDGIAQARRVSERIISEARKPFLYEDRTCRFGASIGIASTELHPDASIEDLMSYADVALYESKNKGRGIATVFGHAQQKKVIRKSDLIEAVNAGIEAGEFVPYFQPQIAAASREIVGFEVLARWLHPTRGVLGPAEFLSVSEELNCTHLIDRAIFDQTADFLTESARAGICVPRVSFNVSLSWISDPTILELASIVQGGGTVFCLELLESFFSEGSAKDAQTSCHIGRLRSAGIEIELDDFGLSKTSLPGVMSIQPDRLKIDRRLILPMLGDVETRQLVSVLIEAGRSLGFAITAAGVESAEHAEVLRSLGCDFLQGYAFSEPMPASDVAGFLQTWRSGTREALGNIA